jgi:hypothetical protein
MYIFLETENREGGSSYIVAHMVLSNVDVNSVLTARNGYRLLTSVTKYSTFPDFIQEFLPNFE